jgi:hypothetical protein
VACCSRLDSSTRTSGRTRFHDESLDLVVGDIAGPDHDEVGKGGVSDPLLLAVQHPDVTVSLRGRRQSAGRARAHVWFGQRERSDLLHPGHGRQPAVLLLLRPAQIDGTHGEPAVHAHERGDRAVRARQLHGDHAVQQRVAAGAAVAFTGQAGDTERRQAGDQLVRELLPGPVVVDDGANFFLHELADGEKLLPACGAEQLLERVKVRVDDRVHVRRSFPARAALEPAAPR